MVENRRRCSISSFCRELWTPLGMTSVFESVRVPLLGLSIRLPHLTFLGFTSCPRREGVLMMPATILMSQSDPYARCGEERDTDTLINDLWPFLEHWRDAQSV